MHIKFTFITWFTIKITGRTRLSLCIHTNVQIFYMTVSKSVSTEIILSSGLEYIWYSKMGPFIMPIRFKQ